MLPTELMLKKSSQIPGATVNTAPIARVVDPIRGDHYGQMRMQPLEFIMANDLDFLAGNVIKYVTRAALSSSIEQRRMDLAKARHYINLMIDREETREEIREKARDANI